MTPELKQWKWIRGNDFPTYIKDVYTGDINVPDGMFCMNGTTSVPKSVLRYSVDKVRQESESEVCYFLLKIDARLNSKIDLEFLHISPYYWCCDRVIAHDVINKQGA